MADVFSREKRSEIMSRIHQPTRLETEVHRWLESEGIPHEMYPKVEGRPDVRIVLPDGGDVYVFIDGCVPPDTLILGDNKLISAIRANDRCLGLGGLASVVRPYSHAYSGPLVTIKALGVLPFRLTPDHPVLAVSVARHEVKRPRHRTWRVPSEPAWVPAGLLEPKRHYLVIPRLAGVYETRTLDISAFARRPKGCVLTELPLDPEVAFLLGLYVADGYAHTGNWHVYFYLNTTEQRVVERVRGTLERLGLGCHLRTRGNVTEVATCSRPLVGALRAWCGGEAGSKAMPDFILLHRDEAVLRGFLEGYMAGDGHASPHPNGRGRSYLRCVAGTVSLALALQLQLAFARLGLFASLSPMRRTTQIMGRPVRARQAYRVEVFPDGGGRGRAIVTDWAILTPVTSLCTEYYRGTVYNMETTDHTYLVSNVVVHNCFWHMCPKHYRRPKTNTEFWVRHIEEAEARRREVRARLPYRWVRVWECEVRDGSYKRLILSLVGRS